MNFVSDMTLHILVEIDSMIRVAPLQILANDLCTNSDGCWGLADGRPS